LTFLISCGENEIDISDLKPIYSDFENVWEKRNLFGKVKEIEFSKIVYQNQIKVGKSNKVFIEKFTKFGALREKSNFNENDKFFQKDVYEFDGEILIKNISTNKKGVKNYVLNIKTDTINNTIINEWSINDTLNLTMKLFYNQNDLLIKKIIIKQNDTTVANNEYIFDKANRIVTERQIEEYNDEPIYVNKYIYDNFGNLTKSIHKTTWTTFVTETEWKENRILKQTEYTISADKKQHLDQESKFDKLYNPINIKIYNNSELNRELKYDYIFDKKGNWTQREVKMKEHFAGSSKFIPIYSEIRKIEYWE
jgi:hypothetical protein